ncbi:histidine triad protein [Spiroplasma clarkii]|uniref:Histidine triad protein n=1 Tax=Spiroplasma clarkii TaxID=2139 RepID=A0A1Y0L0M8_9MOLU|nr:HIT domain-containing protein [Spiroplasma clarkii]ARU91268.1 histidine triad protein [Spiroplasma clarkii]ATX70705.1 histidine triad protein [Spiroplasma clarkii]
MKDCIFCKIINQELPCKKIYEDDLCLAFLDIAPNSDGHCLVIPKTHSEDLTSSSFEDLQAVAIAKVKVVEILNAKLPQKPAGYNFISNQGAEAYQVVFHYHEHIVPKYVKDEGYTIKINKNPKDLTPDELYEYFTSK